ncbi:glycosyltransferase family 2 protein [Alkalicoccobacillus gibsonii]|uniref:glycosyltransferase family 2 protein n=1 Tax=Alkalicoccobacillus gibsonii TaxID=79881 RepID=UPI001931606D|nr:glycosyltransferase [Alkalicoccobacillus gibsonii]MBM0065988.1 glycosyltransferase [Alkalicoccobacillus gibsonii]
MNHLLVVILYRPPFHTVFTTLASIRTLQLESIWLIHSPSETLPSLPDDVHLLEVKPEELGKQLNTLIHSRQKVDSALVLFSGVQTLIHEDTTVMVSGNEEQVWLQNQAWTRSPFPGTRYIPFKEAFLAYWLNQLPKDMTFQPLKAPTQRRLPITERAKLEFAGTYEQPNEQLTCSVTVLIAHYNHVNTVDAAIASCLVGRFVPEQILVIDDASTDSSKEHLATWEHPTLHIHFLKQNGGKARALNAGLPYIRTPFILELDPDDWLDPDAFTKMRESILSWPEQSPLLYGNFRRWNSSEHELQYKGIAKGRPIYSKAELLAYRHPLGPRLYRTSSLKKIGGFPELNYADGRLYEDVAVMYKLLEEGSFHYVDQTFYNVRNHQDSITQKNHAMWNGFLTHLKNLD